MKPDLPTTRPELRCTGCGARLVDATGACTYCGSTIDVATVSVQKPEQRPEDARGERFRRFKESREHARLLAWRPSSAGARAEHIARIVLAAAIVVGSWIAGATMLARDTRWLAVVGAAIGLIVMIHAIVRASSFANAPVRAFPAIVRAKRATPPTGGGASPVEYFATFEDERGLRREFEVDPSSYGLVAEDDLGVVYVRDGHLLAFRTR